VKMIMKRQSCVVWLKIIENYCTQIANRVKKAWYYTWNVAMKGEIWCVW
jgi:hypothetical protein